jgi:hypothetical protein
MDLDRRIDELYALPLADFTASRNALAKSLSGDEAKLVRALNKPSAVAWAVNQLFWKARTAFDQLVKQGAALRDAQIAVLKGKEADVQRAAAAHRRALAHAVDQTKDFASVGGIHPNAEDLARMLEAISLAVQPPKHVGRWTESLRPAGFEALANVEPVARAGWAGRLRTVATPEEGTPGLRERAEAERKEAQRAEALQKRLDADVRNAERAVVRAKQAEKRAREGLDRAIENRQATEASLAAARKSAIEHS